MHESLIMSHDQQAAMSNLFSNPALADALYYHSDNIKELLMHITTQLKMTDFFWWNKISIS